MCERFEEPCEPKRCAVSRREAMSTGSGSGALALEAPVGGCAAPSGSALGCSRRGLDGEGLGDGAIMCFPRGALHALPYPSLHPTTATLFFFTTGAFRPGRDGSCLLRLRPSSAPLALETVEDKAPMPFSFSNWLRIHRSVHVPPVGLSHANPHRTDSHEVG